MKIVIDGNIGSGKTTQLDMLEKKGWLVQREPINEWPLELFYKDKSRWALLLQLKILQTLQPMNYPQVVYERCLLSARHVFWEYLVQKNLVCAEEDKVYCNQYSKDAWYPDVYIFLSKHPEVAYQHIQTRNQPGDTGVTLEYLQDLDILYSRMLMNIPCVVHIINAHQTPEAIHSQILSLLQLYGTMHVPHTRWEKMQKAVSDRWKMLRTSFPDMCNMSRPRTKSQFSWGEKTLMHPLLPHELYNDLV